MIATASALIAALNILLFVPAQAEIPAENQLAQACKTLNTQDVISLLKKDAKPNAHNYFESLIEGVLAITPPTDIQEQPQGQAVTTIFDTLFKAGVNPLTYKDENTYLLKALEQVWSGRNVRPLKDPVVIALRNMLHALLVYEVGEPKAGDSKLVANYMRSIITLYKQLSDRNLFDPLNTPLVTSGIGIIGENPIKLAARNGHYYCLQEMLAAQGDHHDSLATIQTALDALINASEKKVLYVAGKSCKDLLAYFIAAGYSDSRNIFTPSNKNILIHTTQKNAAISAWQQKTQPKDVNKIITHEITKLADAVDKLRRVGKGWH
jgi:hypothetical protein